MLRRSSASQISGTTLCLAPWRTFPASRRSALCELRAELMHRTCQRDIDAMTRVSKRRKLGLNTAGARWSDCRQLMTN